MTMNSETSNPSAPRPPVTRIRATKGWIAPDLRELWESRELLFFLTWRDIKVKYTQALLGVGWAVLVPFGQMVVFTFIFGNVAGLPSDGLPRPIFYFAALLPWTYFAGALTMSSNSLVGNADMLTKIYFPRLIVPIAPCVAGLLDLAIAFVILLLMMLFFKIPPAATSLLLPLLIVMAFTTALGMGLFLAALNVKYRDIRHAIPFVIQMWMYCSVIIPFSNIPERFGIWRYLYGLNPMAGVIEGFRWCLLHHRMTVEKLVDGQMMQVAVPPPWALLAIGMPVTIAMLVFGLFYFRRMERMFADLV